MRHAVNRSVANAMLNTDWMQSPGVWALVDGQYGSTGKGLAAAFLAELYHDKVGLVTTNAGPNSGHTSYFGDEKIVLQQLPTFGVISRKMGSSPLMRMNAGAIVDETRLDAEAGQYGLTHVHPHAARVTDEAREQESTMIGRIGSTGKGTGAALARKVMRDPDAVMQGRSGENFAITLPCSEQEDPRKTTVMMEVSQGYSLSLNASGMYPYTTSRDCTVAQALSDAGFHPFDLRGTMMVVRTFPIRVAGNSGPCYADQREITWGELGVEPEITTVTKKVRRVFTFSRQQFMDAVRANRPEYIFVNFMNYLNVEGAGGDKRWINTNIIGPYREVMGAMPKMVLMGHGPNSCDVTEYEEDLW